MYCVQYPPRFLGVSDQIGVPRPALLQRVIELALGSGSYRQYHYVAGQLHYHVGAIGNCVPGLDRALLDPGHLDAGMEQDVEPFEILDDRPRAAQVETTEAFGAASRMTISLRELLSIREIRSGASA